MCEPAELAALLATCGVKKGAQAKIGLALNQHGRARQKAATIDRLNAQVDEAALHQERLERALAEHTSELKRLRGAMAMRGGVPREFECPITTDVMLEPTIAADGHTYDPAAIVAWSGMKLRPALVSCSQVRQGRHRRVALEEAGLARHGRADRPEHPHPEPPRALADPRVPRQVQGARPARPPLTPNAARRGRALASARPQHRSSLARVGVGPHTRAPPRAFPRAGTAPRAFSIL